ncbi:hypothetical protein GGR51DRAFT_352964 [Nemania sp. FL0031]|nr:hypothetical protein GGR51DRAFT_352964 [Nemania sp. FL0031]
MERAVRPSTRSASARSHELLAAPTTGTLSKGRITTETNTTTRASLPQANRRVFYHQKERGFVYRDSSVPTSSHSNSTFNERNTRSSSRPINSDSISLSNGIQCTIPERDDIADDQQSTEPIPPDFDPAAIFGSSPPSRVRQDGPVTRNRARLQALTITNHAKSSSPIYLGHEPENPNPKTNNDGYQLSSPSARQDLPVRKVRGGTQSQNIDGFDGSIEGYSPHNDEGLAELDSEAESPKCNLGQNDDDAYELSESENVTDSELSTIVELMKHSKGSANKNPSKVVHSSSKPKGKQVAKARTAPIGNKIGHSARGKTAVSVRNRVPSPKRRDFPPSNIASVHQNARVSAESNDQDAVGFIPDSQDVGKGSQGGVISLQGTTSSSKIRRPKKPFYTHDIGGPSKSGPTMPTLSNGDTNQGLTQQKAAAPSPSLDKTQRGDKATQNANKNKRTAPNISQSKPKRQKGGKIPEQQQSDKEKGYVNNHNQAALATAEIEESLGISLSNQDLQLSDEEHEEMLLQSSLSYRTEVEISKRPSDSGSSEQRTKTSDTTPVIQGSLSNFHVSRQARLPRLDSGSVDFGGRAEIKNEATQTGVFTIESSPQRLYEQEEPKKTDTGNDSIPRSSLKSPQAFETREPLWVRPVTTRVGRESQRPYKPAHSPPGKTLIDSPTTEELLHPTSLTWAQAIAEEARQKKLVLKSLEESEPLGRTPIMTHQARKHPIAKRETTLADRRNAIFGSIQHITKAVLGHLKSKESAIDNIVGVYQRSGHKLIDALLDRQSMELRQTVSAFDKKCLRLEILFEKTGRHVRAISHGAPTKGNPHFRDWTQRRENAEDAIKMTREAVASI